jgi:heavy metal sensor kinase
MIFHNKSIRFILTLVNSTAIVSIFVIVAFFIILLYARISNKEINKQLETGFRTVEETIINSGGDIYDIQHLPQSLPFAVWESNEIIYMSQSWSYFKLSLNLDDYTSKADNLIIDRKRGKRYIVLHGRVPKYNYDIAFALETSDFRFLFIWLAIITAIGLLLVLIMSVLGGGFLTGKALKPMKDLAEKAANISADTLSERLPIHNKNDEIGKLSLVINEMLERLENSFESLKRFTADASHELRTPLTSIRSVGEVALSSEQSSVSYKEAIGSMLEETNRINRLIDDLLILSRGDAGKEIAKIQRVELNSYLDCIVNELKVLAEEKNQTITVEAKEGLFAEFDPDRLKIAILNVIHNAIRYSPEGGRIRINVENDEAHAVKITISDSGSGIPPEEREKVFERFYRIDEARTREEGGSGLGLSIAKWAVEINGGSITFVEPENGGSCCQITV